MNNQNRILNHRQLDDIVDDAVSFHEEEEEHNYLGKKELLEIEGDKSIDPDYSYDEDKSKGSSIKRNTNTELMKLLSESTTEVYHKKISTNNLNGSIENDFSKELSRDSELNNIINSKNFNAPLMRPGNDNFISSINQFDNQNPNLKYSNIIQQIPTKIDNNFYYGNSNFNTDYDNILNNKNNTFINNNSKKFKNNNFNTFNKFNNNNKIYQINSFDYFIQGKNLNNFKQSNPSFGILQNIELEKNYKELEKNYNELEKSYNEVLNLIEYWQNFYLDIAKLVLENININKNDPFSNEFKFAVIENVKSIVKLAKDKAFSIFKICNEESFNLLNHKMSLKNKKNDFTLYNNLNIEIIGKEKNNILMFSKENESKKNIIQELNYKNIELTQKIESLESINKINQKIQSSEPETMQKDYFVELNQLYNKINEMEIKNSKLSFDNKNLENKIEWLKKDKKSDIEILELLHKKKIENLEKNIANLNNTINELLNENKKQPKEINFEQIQNEVYQNFAQLEQKIRKYDEENFMLKKENQKLKNENEELKIIINGKDNIIDKLQSNISKLENDFKLKLSELNSNFKSQINNKIENNMIDENNNNENIENLLNDQKRLMEENEILKTNYEQMTVGINEANELFINKQKEYENIINYQNEKLKEYKFKISLLKIKINELHSEIESLKNKQIQNQNNFYQKFNDNVLSTIDKDQNSIDLNFTPEQIKLMNSYNTPINNPNSNLKYQINNLNTNNK